MSLDLFKTDTNLEINGVEITVGQNEDGTNQTFIVARMSKSNKAYQKALTAAAAPYQREIQLKIDVSEKLEEAFKKVFVNTILKGWKNIPASVVTGEKKQNGYAEFSPQNALLLINNLPDLYDYLQDRANEQALFREVEKEESAKN